MIIISQDEINSYLKNICILERDKYKHNHSAFSGEKEFVLLLLANCIALLRQAPINDTFIIQYLEDLISISRGNKDTYKIFLENMIKEESINHGETLSVFEEQILKELMESQWFEYLTKSDYSSCCYSAMEAFFITAYCILRHNINTYIKNIDIIVDLYDEVIEIKLEETKSASAAIYVDWHSTNKINDMFMLYKTEYICLDDGSILDLVAADVIEKDYYLKDERFTIAPSILVKQYCSIIEHEVNQIIQLYNLPNKPKGHLMWLAMKTYVKENNIDLDASGLKLYTVLNQLYKMRNDSSHGEIITNMQYEKLRKYKNLGLFRLISAKKLDLKNIKISPTIEELKTFLK